MTTQRRKKRHRKGKKACTCFFPSPEVWIKGLLKRKKTWKEWTWKRRDTSSPERKNGWRKVDGRGQRFAGGCRGQDFVKKTKTKKWDALEWILDASLVSFPSTWIQRVFSDQFIGCIRRSTYFLSLPFKRPEIGHPNGPFSLTNESHLAAYRSSPTKPKHLSARMLGEIVCSIAR